jgi:epoxyqueuosine reductase
LSHTGRPIGGRIVTLKMTTEQSLYIKDLAETEGADFFGIADLTPARAAILAQGGSMIAEFPHAISIGITLLHSIVDQLPQRAQRAVASNYLHHSYDVINQRLDLLASQLSSALQRQGSRALPIPSSRRVDDARLCGAFSHKLAAHLAGLGWIGKSCLLVTPEVGPRVRWATVLTDAPLSATGEALKERCGDCVECVQICPVKAFSGRSFRTGEPRDARYDASKCDRYFAWMKKKDPDTAACGLCLYICPYGRRRQE